MSPEQPRSTLEIEIEHFISLFSGSRETFLYGACYWFAYILAERFKHVSPIIMYAPGQNHFACRIGEHNYDVSGRVSITGYQSWSNYSLVDPLHAERIERYCVNML